MMMMMMMMMIMTVLKSQGQYPQALKRKGNVMNCDDDHDGVR